MFSTKKIAAVAAACALAIVATPAMAGPMVVRSTGPSAKSYPVGKPLAANATLSLKAGDAVTVLDAGGTRVLRGPGSVAVSGSSAATGSGFGRLLANTGARQARTGATRSAIGGGPARSPNVWYVDASKGGAQCFVDDASAAIWRPDDSQAGSIVVTALGGGKSANVAYRPGQSVRAWPAELPLIEGASYTLSIEGGGAPVTIKPTFLGSASESLDGVASAFVAKGCANQLDVLVEGSLQEHAVVSVR